MDLAKYTDIILLNHNFTKFNKPLTKSKTIFINCRLGYKLIYKFIDKILVKLDHPINLIIAGEDKTFPKNIDTRHKDPVFSKKN